MIDTWIKVRSKRRTPGSPHIDDYVYLSQDGENYAYAGRLTFRTGEWQTFGAMLVLGAQHSKGRVSVILEGDLAIVANT